MTDPVRNLSELAALLEKATPAPWRENTFNHKHEIKADGNVIGFVRRLEDAQLAAFLVNNAASIAARLRSMEEALKDSSDAIDFFDKVKAASRDEQNAVGTDHWDWLEKAARKARAALSNAGGL